MDISKSEYTGTNRYSPDLSALFRNANGKEWVPFDELKAAVETGNAPEHVCNAYLDLLGIFD